MWLQQLSTHLLGCSRRDQAKCCSHISKWDDYSCLASLDQTWFHRCCKCHFEWLSVCRSSPCWHIQKLDIPLSTFPLLFFLPYIPVLTTVCLYICSSASHQSSIYYRHLFLITSPTFSKQWVTYLLSLYFLPVSLQTFIPFICFVSPTPFFFHPRSLFLKILNYLWLSASLHLLHFLSLLSFLYLPPSPPLTSLTLFLNLYHFPSSILVCSSNGLRLFSHYKVLEYTIF